MNNAQEMYKAFVSLVKENPSPTRRKFLFKWVAMELGFMTALMSEEGESFEALDLEIRQFMEKGVDKYLALRESIPFEEEEAAQIREAS